MRKDHVAMNYIIHISVVMDNKKNHVLNYIDTWPIYVRNSFYINLRIHLSFKFHCH